LRVGLRFGGFAIARGQRVEGLEALRRERGQQAAQVTEVVGGSAVRHAGAARTFPQREALQALFPDEAFRGGEQGFPQGTVVVAPFRALRSGTSIHRVSPAQVVFDSV
jgi:hypothetical protein